MAKFLALLVVAGGSVVMIVLCCGGLASVDTQPAPNPVATNPPATANAVDIASAGQNLVADELPPISTEEDPVEPESMASEDDKPPVDVPEYIQSLPELQLGHSGPGLVGQMEIIQILGPTTFIGEYGGDLAFVEGYSTSGMVDGNVYGINGVFMGAGTQSYENLLGGTRTIHRIRQMTVSEMVAAATAKRDREEAERKAEAERQEAMRIAEAEEKAARREPDSIGKFKGAMLHHDNGNIHLRNQRLKELIDEYSDTTGGKQAREFIDTELGGELK